MQSDVGEEILYEITTELKVFIWCSLRLHWSIMYFSKAK